MKLSDSFLSSLIACQHSPDQIQTLFEENKLGFDYLKTLQSHRDPQLPYSRKILANSEHCEVMLAFWTPGKVCAPHDHGSSHGWVFYLDGTFSERAYSWDGTQLVAGGLKMHAKNSYTGVGAGEIHSCVSSDPGCSLHVYFPRIQAMKVYDVSNRKTLIVEDDSGAWVPLDDSKIKEVEVWQTHLQTLPS